MIYLQAVLSLYLSTGYSRELVLDRLLQLVYLEGGIGKDTARKALAAVFVGRSEMKGLLKSHFPGAWSKVVIWVCDCVVVVMNC